MGKIGRALKNGGIDSLARGSTGALAIRVNAMITDERSMDGHNGTQHCWSSALSYSGLEKSNMV